MKELAIGEVGEIDGVRVKCVVGDGCNTCRFNLEDDTPCKSIACVSWERTDNKNVYYVEIKQ